MKKYKAKLRKMSWKMCYFFFHISVISGSRSVTSSFLQSHKLHPARFLCPQVFCRQEYWSGFPCPPSGDLSNPGIEPRSPAFQADSLPSEPPGKPKNTGVGSLSLLKGIFPTQQSNQGLLYCRQILLPTELWGKPLYIINCNFLLTRTACFVTY